MPGESSKPARILIVDDDQFLSDMYALKFRESGYDVVALQASEEALHRLEAGEKFDALVLDVVMPGLSGLGLLEAVHSKKLGGDPAIIMLTNQGQDADVEAALDRGADGYIVKASVVPSEVVTKVEEVINAHK